MAAFLWCQNPLNISDTLNMKHNIPSPNKGGFLKLFWSTSLFLYVSLLFWGLQSHIHDEIHVRISVSALLKLRIHGCWPNWEWKTWVFIVGWIYLSCLNTMMGSFCAHNYFCKMVACILHPLFFILMSSTIVHCLVGLLIFSTLSWIAGNLWWSGLVLTYFLFCFPIFLGELPSGVILLLSGCRLSHIQHCASLTLGLLFSLSVFFLVHYMRTREILFTVFISKFLLFVFQRQEILVKVLNKPMFICLKNKQRNKKQTWKVVRLCSVI